MYLPIVMLFETSIDDWEHSTGEAVPGYYITGEEYYWDYWKTRYHLKAMTYIAYAFGIFTAGCQMGKEDIVTSSLQVKPSPGPSYKNYLMLLGIQPIISSLTVKVVQLKTAMDTLRISDISWPSHCMFKKTSIMETTGLLSRRLHNILLHSEGLSIGHIHKNPLTGLIYTQLGTFFINMGDHQSCHLSWVIGKAPFTKA